MGFVLSRIVVIGGLDWSPCFSKVLQYLAEDSRRTRAACRVA